MLTLTNTKIMTGLLHFSSVVPTCLMYSFHVFEESQVLMLTIAIAVALLSFV